MIIITPVIVVFVISFILLFLWIYNGEKNEIKAEKKKIFSAIGASFILTLAPSAFIGLSLFVLLGSTNTVNMIFSLNISTKQLVILAISFFVYLFTIDNIIELIIFYYPAPLVKRPPY
ncbi:hypothetical protein [Oceanobacillus rekensis]|uniref:hypothetical protein n=1 Tax=Oceanobacillus rekensis TaxID=937927 RepID=UPI000B44B7DF|nr:hypothetical protein [Oceanobacillus rekensis]